MSQDVPAVLDSRRAGRRIWAQQIVPLIPAVLDSRRAGRRVWAQQIVPLIPAVLDSRRAGRRVWVEEPLTGMSNRGSICIPGVLLRATAPGQAVCVSSHLIARRMER